MQYVTQDSRLAAYFLLKGIELLGTETRCQKDDDRVYLQFDIPEPVLVQLKREFFEGASVPALSYANELKRAMWIVREARELARESR